jgi:hypothetical protein
VQVKFNRLKNEGFIASVCYRPNSKVFLTFLLKRERERERERDSICNPKSKPMNLRNLFKCDGPELNNLVGMSKPRILWRCMLTDRLRKE